MEWKFKEGAEATNGSDGFWYELTVGGYIKPENFLSDSEQLSQLRDAIKLVRSFELALVDNDLWNEF